jgi:hypothetical protein
LTRDEYFARQRSLVKSQARAEYRQAVLIRRAHREFYAPLIEAVSKGDPPQIDRQDLAERIEAIIRAESVKPAEEAEALQAEMEASLLGKARNTIPRQTVKNEVGKITDAEWRKKRKDYDAGKITADEWFAFEKEYYAGRPSGKGRQSFGSVKTAGVGWAVKGSPKTGVSSYRRDPKTGKIIWDTTPLEWVFSKRYDLSSSVWKAVEEEEQAIFTVVRTGRAMGRDVKDIAKDLEKYINYSNGGERVMARWGNMFPNTDEGRREAWKRQYLIDHPGPDRQPYQMFTDEAREALRSPEATAYLKEKMTAKTRPDMVKAYHGRLGKAGIDYRTMRIMRTETAVALNERQEAIARNSLICTGEVDWILQKGRDGWNCKCADYAAGGPYDVDDLPGPIPAHPNCVKRGTRILTTKGYKNIEAISPGDFVISHDGTANQITAMYKTKYHGEMIRLNNGPWTTPKHGFLTSDGWVTAQSLNKGDDFTTISGNSRVDISSSNFISHNCPSKRIKEGSFVIVLGNFARTGSMPLTAIYFDGKLYIGICEVDVIFSYCESGDWGEIKTAEFHKKHCFINTIDLSSSTNRSSQKTCFRMLHSFNGLMRRLNVGLKPRRIKPRSCFLYSGGNDTNGHKFPIDTSTRNTKNLSDNIYRQAVFLKKDSQPFKVNISFNTHANILAKKHMQYNGDIFDLTVSVTNSYVANGVVVHNCNCQLRPHLKTSAQIQEEFRRLSAADDEIIKQWREQGNA